MQREQQQLLRRRVVASVDELSFLRLEKKKREDKFADAEWGEWLSWVVKDIPLADTFDAGIERSTRDNLMDLWIKNFRENLPRILNGGKSISDLVPVDCLKMKSVDPPPPLGSAIVIGRGPSLLARKHLELLSKSNYEGTVIATDGILGKCLESGIVPNYVVSIDGHPELIRKHYDHPLVEKHAPSIACVLNTTCSPNVAKKVIEAGFDGPYWFNPLFDDPFHPKNESFTKIMNIMTKDEKYHPKGVPDVSCLGHCGGTCWVMAWQLLRRNPVCLIGIDLAYLPDTPPEQMDYYQSFIAESAMSNQPLSVILGKQLRKLHNPGFDCECLVDPVFSHYGKSFTESLAQTPWWVRTVNCTEGGQVYHEDEKLIKCQRFENFLKENPK